MRATHPIGHGYTMLVRPWRRRDRVKPLSFTAPADPAVLGAPGTELRGRPETSYQYDAADAGTARERKLATHSLRPVSSAPIGSLSRVPHRTRPLIGDGFGWDCTVHRTAERGTNLCRQRGLPIGLAENVETFGFDDTR